MKKVTVARLLLAGVLLFASCDSDDTTSGSTDNGDGEMRGVFAQSRQYESESTCQDSDGESCVELLIFLQGDSAPAAVEWYPDDVAEDGTYFIEGDTVTLDIGPWPSARGSLRLDETSNTLVDDAGNTWTRTD